MAGATSGIGSIDALPVVVGHDIAEYYAPDLAHRHFFGLNLIEASLSSAWQRSSPSGHCHSSARMESFLLGQRLPEIRTGELAATAAASLAFKWIGNTRTR